MLRQVRRAETLARRRRRARVAERLSAAGHGARARQLRARSLAPWPRWSRLAARRGCRSCGCWPPARCPLGLEDEHRHPLEPLTPGRVGRAVRPRGRSSCDGSSSSTPATATVDPGSLPVPRRAAAGDRARRGAGAVAVGRVTSPDASTTGSPCCATRPAADPSDVGPSQARSPGATSCCSPTTSAGCGRSSCFAGGAPLRRRRARARGARRARRRRCSTRSAGSSTARWSSSTRGEDGDVRYRLLDSIRAYAGDRLRESGQARRRRCGARRLVRRTAPTGATSTSAASASRSACAIARAERANVDVALAWCSRERSAARRAASPTGSAGPGSCSATAPPGPRGSATRCSTDDAHRARRATGLLLAGWLEASAGDVVLAQADLDDARAARRTTRRRGAARPTRTGTRPSWPSSRAGRTSSSPAARPAWRRTARRGWSGAPPRACCSSAFGSLMLGDTAYRRPGRRRGGRRS